MAPDMHATKGPLTEAGKDGGLYGIREETVAYLQLFGSN